MSSTGTTLARRRRGARRRGRYRTLWSPQPQLPYPLSYSGRGRGQQRKRAAHHSTAGHLRKEIRQVSLRFREFGKIKDHFQRVQLHRIRAHSRSGYQDYSDYENPVTTSLPDRLHRSSHRSVREQELSLLRVRRMRREDEPPLSILQ